jgi:hypothetical protein
MAAPVLTFRKILLIVLGAEAAFAIGVIAVAVIFHLDPNGSTYWKEARDIAALVLLVLIAPAFLLAFFGGYALVLATPLAAFALFMCLTPYLGWLFDYGLMIAPGIAAVLAGIVAFFVMRERRSA